MARVWFCQNCGYEVHARGRCHACRSKLVASALPQLESGPEDDEVGYRIDGWTDRDRGRLILRLNDLGVEHRFEDDELVVDAADESRVDDLVSALGLTAEAGLADDPVDDYEMDDLGGSETGEVDLGDDGEEDPGGDGDFNASVRLLADAATRLRRDPTDMQADADLGQASAAVFMVDHYGPFDEEAWSAVGRVTRRLLALLGAEEAMDEAIRREGGVLEKLLAPFSLPAGTGHEGSAEPAGERTVYELAEWLPDQRAQLGVLLDDAGIAYVWEGDELLVPSSREAETEALFDEVAGTSAADDDEGDERRYQAVAELFAACGRLAGDPTDGGRREAVLHWVGQSEGAPLLGMDEVDWFRIRSRARALALAIEEEHDPDEVYEEANTLHGLLRTVV